MNAWRITAGLVAAAAAALTVWFYTEEGEAPEQRIRPALSAGLRAPSPHTATGRPGAPAYQPAAGSSRSIPDDFPPRQAAPGQTLTEAARVASGKPVRRQPVNTPVLPLAFREMPAGLELEAAQTLAVEEVQDQFIAALGGETADPAAPEYRKKWIDSQRHADLQLRARIGAQAFAAYQRARLEQARP